MKKLAIVVFSFLLVGITAKANNQSQEDYVINRYDGKTYIFEEGGVEFSVFADGQFDFAYVGPNHGGDVQVNVSTPNVNISFNSGHDYEMYVQYDDYGAVIQIENVPIYYDGYGRITQAGDVDIQYNDRRIVRVGGLHINYDHYGYYSGYTGYINVYNRYYIARPWHVFYTRPIYSSCIVYDYPYRRYYSPVRYSYGHHRSFYHKGYRSGYKNARRDFYRPGSRIHDKNGRTTVNKDYRANRRNTMVSNRSDRNNTRNVVKKGDRSSVNKGRQITSRNDVKRTANRSTINKDRTTTNRKMVKRDNRNSAASKNRTVNSKRANTATRPQQHKSRVAQNNTKRKVNSGTTSRSSNKQAVKRNTTSRSNTSAKSGTSSKSRTTSKRGRRL